MSKKTLKSINFNFLQRNQTKLPKDFSELCLQSKRFVYLHEGGSVLSYPPNMGLTGDFCVCVGQNVIKRQKNLRIFDILMFCRHFADMLMTFITKTQAWKQIFEVSVVPCSFIDVNNNDIANLALSKGAKVTQLKGAAMLAIHVAERPSFD